MRKLKKPLDKPSLSCYNVFVGANGCEVPPVPIPNTEVKLTNAENTWLVTARENRTVPIHYPHTFRYADFFVTVFIRKDIRNMKKNKILSVVICAALTCGLMTACGEASSAADDAETTASSEETTAAEETPSTVALTNESAKLLGRTYLMDDTLWCGFSGTGAEFEYTGSKLDITLIADSNYSSEGNQARAAVYVDGERVLDEMLDEAQQTFTVYEGESKTVDVKIVKLSESANSVMGIGAIELESGETIAPAAAKAHKIEFVGDSITCGYGVDDEVKEHHFSTSTEDVTKTYAYKTADALDADYSIVSASGFGIISGYTSDPSKKVANQTLPQYYNKTGFSYSGKFGGTETPQSIDWDFEEFVPDAIVINLGTNDESYCKSDLQKQSEYVDAYIEFLKEIREKNPDAEIFCALGTMGAGLFTSVQETVIKYTEETGDEKVHAVQLPTQDGSKGYAADWHPTEGTHQDSADVLSAEISSVMGW